LKDTGAVAAAMSGSGSAVFGLFRTRAGAERAARPLSTRGARVIVTRTLSRSVHERRARPIARRNV
jgi:4-diphosphocytidyl-2-C-methyl-D-erythritol kinase